MLIFTLLVFALKELLTHCVYYLRGRQFNIGGGLRAESVIKLIDASFKLI